MQLCGSWVWPEHKGGKGLYFREFGTRIGTHPFRSLLVEQFLSHFTWIHSMASPRCSCLQPSTHGSYHHSLGMSSTKHTLTMHSSLPLEVLPWLPVAPNTKLTFLPVPPTSILPSSQATPCRDLQTRYLPPSSCHITLFLKVKLRGHCLLQGQCRGPVSEVSRSHPDLCAIYTMICQIREQLQLDIPDPSIQVIGSVCTSSNNTAANDTNQGLVFKTKTSYFPNQTPCLPPRTRPALTLWSCCLGYKAQTFSSTQTGSQPEGIPKAPNSPIGCFRALSPG